MKYPRVKTQRNISLLLLATLRDTRETKFVHMFEIDLKPNHHKRFAHPKPNKLERNRRH